jgi:hypothetical protein
MEEQMQATDFRCPHCHASIPPADVNVATDLALCRACGRTTTFAIASGASEITLDCLATLPRGVRVEEGFFGETTITYRRLSPILLFLIPFTALWSGGSMIGIYGNQIKEGKFDLAQSLFGIPFAFGTIVLLTFIVYLIFGKWVVMLKSGEGTVFVGAGPLGWTRRFTYNRDTVVSLCMTSTQVNNQPQKGILVRTDGKDLIFGALLKEDVKCFIAAAIMREAGK